MYDYKSRQSELSFSKPKRTWHKSFLLVAKLALAAAVVYGILQLGLPWLPGFGAPETDSDFIPLPPPSHVEPEEDTQPANSELGVPEAIRTDRAFSEAPQARQQLGHAGPSAAAIDEDAPFPRQAVDTENGSWIEHEVQPGDTLARIFRDNGLSPQLLQSILGSGKEAKHLETIRPKDKLRVHVGNHGQFVALHYQLDALRSVQFAATDSGIQGTTIRKAAQTKATAASGIIDRTLFASARKAGLPDAVTLQLATVFGWDIDFALEIRPGDWFSVIYEEKWADGAQVGPGDIIAAEFVNQGDSHRAVRFKTGDGKFDYYSPDGTLLRKTFFRTPVKFTRISSGFSNRRWHPVLKRRRAHKGVDYAAPRGTPVIATGDATVEYRGWKRGYGRVVYLRHGSKYRTVYGHLSRFAKGLSKGDRVKQGELIGYVGQSGLATGPHLHYEFHVGGVHRDPLTVKAPIADPLPPKELQRFHETARPLLASLEQSANDAVVLAAR